MCRRCEAKAAQNAAAEALERACLEATVLPSNGRGARRLSQAFQPNPEMPGDFSGLLERIATVPARTRPRARH